VDQLGPIRARDGACERISPGTSRHSTIEAFEGLRDDSDCLRFIKLAKQYSGFRFAQARGQKLWQRYGFERIVRDDEATLVVARYVLQNPVRAGLVTDARQYPFVGSEKHSIEELLDAMADVRST